MSDETNNPAAEPETPAGEAAPSLETAQAEIDAGFAVIEKLTSENADLRDKLLRAIADGDNTRKRLEREKTDAARYASANFARDMLQVGDNLRRALETLSEEDRASMSDNVKALLEGVEMTERAMLSTFERHGIRQIMPVVGDRFDANQHEAMFEVPGTGQPGGTIVQVLEAGYLIGDRLLRAARVGVAKAEAGAVNGSQVDTTA